MDQSEAASPDPQGGPGEESTEELAMRVGAAAAAAVQHPDEEPGFCTLTNGIRFKIRAVPPFVLRTPSDLPEPQIPMVRIEDQDRSEPNPDDPTYRREHAQWEENVGLAAVNKLMILATTTVNDKGEFEARIDHIPEGIWGPDSDLWITWLKNAGVEDIDVSTPQIRYLSWLRNYACASPIDIARLQIASSKASGTLNVDVAMAMDAHKSDTGRGEHSNGATGGNRADRRAASRKRSGDGAKSGRKRRS